MGVSPFGHPDAQPRVITANAAVERFGYGPRTMAGPPDGTRTRTRHHGKVTLLPQGRVSGREAL